MFGSSDPFSTTSEDQEPWRGFPNHPLQALPSTYNRPSLGGSWAPQPHSPREEPPGLSSSTFHGSSPCCNREITFGLENRSPVHKQKKKERKKRLGFVLTQRGSSDLSGNSGAGTKASVGSSSCATRCERCARKKEETCSTQLSNN